MAMSPPEAELGELASRTNKGIESLPSWAYLLIGTFVFMVANGQDLVLVPKEFFIKCLCWGYVFQSCRNLVGT